MNKYQLSIYHLNRGDTERVTRDSILSEGAELFTPSSLCTSESASSNSGSYESIPQVLISFDRSIKNWLSSCDTKEKPPHSYIAMISMAILSKPNKKMLINDIYQFIMDTFPFYNNNEKAWRNSIRHNLSLNECFVKIGRSDTCKGNYWSIHQDCIEEFAKGDYRRRNPRRRALKSSVKTADCSSNKFCNRNNYEYVPMTLSQTGFYPYYVKGSFMHRNPQNQHYNQTKIITPVSTCGMKKTQSPSVMHSFGRDSLFPVSQSSLEGDSCNALSSYYTTSSIRPSSYSAFYSSCQIQKDFFDW
ncbi:forkhead box protein I3-like [Mytilus trossulus]|uniref:forkhead box protein I3-like n=1 Tax=Mytilus trossulus TaxID=6551 RepID=UPI003004E663